MEFTQGVPVTLEGRERGKRLSDLVLGIAMLWQDALHTGHDAAGFVSPKFLAAHFRTLPRRRDLPASLPLETPVAAAAPVARQRGLR
jgi:hypothetical protein